MDYRNPSPNNYNCRPPSSARHSQQQQVQPSQPSTSQQYELRPASNNDPRHSNRELRELLAKLSMQDDTDSTEQKTDLSKQEGNETKPEEENWFHLQNCFERLNLIAFLINVPELGIIDLNILV